MRIVILGGTGQAGRAIAGLVSRHTDASVTIASRRLERAKEVSRSFSQGIDGERVTATYADASEPEALRDAFQGADLVIVTSTTASLTENVARACLNVGCDYLDILDSPEIVARLDRLSSEVERAGRLFVTQGGLAPGMPAALVRLARSRVERLVGARLGLAMSLRASERYEQVYDVFDFLVKTKPMAFEDGAWRRKSMRQTTTIDFGRRFGRRPSFAIDMPELRALPEQVGLETLALYGAGTNAALDYLAKSLIIALHRIRPRLGWRTFARLLFWIAQRDAREPSGCSLVLEAKGRRNGADAHVRVLLEHEDNYFATAAVVLSFVRQYRAGAFSAKGVRMMGHLVDPDKTVDDLRDVGVPVSIDDGAPQSGHGA